MRSARFARMGVLVYKILHRCREAHTTALETMCTGGHILELFEVLGQLVEEVAGPLGFYYFVQGVKGNLQIEPAW